MGYELGLTDCEVELAHALEDVLTNGDLGLCRLADPVGPADQERDLLFDVA